ncbi:MAG: sigma-70 family RNA polymerase sigma factor [Methylovulum sp.]|nr:sigma-70 family RNA polymerase sigma factor [Methylovulum sp.]
MNNKAGSERDNIMNLLVMGNGAAEQPEGECCAGGSGDAAVGKRKSSGLDAVEQQHLQDLISRIVDRDQTAFSALYDSLLERVYGLALSMTRCVQLAEEIAEDTFWQVWRQAPRFDPARGNAAAWVMTIARSRALDTMRRTDYAESHADVSGMDLAVPDNPHDLLALVQQGSRVHEALAQLDPLPRQLLALAFFRGFSHDEIAGHTGLPLGTVKSQIRRALLGLRQTLADDADFSR